MLEGIRVLSFTHYLQGPLAAQLIADLGADVIKIEPVTGAHERNAPPLDLFYGRNISISHLDRNRNQRSIAVDLRTEVGREIIRRLLDSTDVIMENFRPGVLEKYGFGYDQLKEKYPKLVYCSITGWGADGPYQRRPGQDLLVQGTSGFAFGTGRKGEAPVVVGVPIIDTMGAMTAAYGTLAAIVGSLRTGKGHFVDTCLLNSAIEMLSDAYPLYFAAGKCFDRLDTGLVSRYYPSPYGAYRTSDGYIIISQMDIETMKSLFGERLAPYTAETALENRQVIDKIVAEEVAKKTTDEWADLLEKHKAWYSKILDYNEVRNDPQVKHNGIFVEMDHPVAGKVTVVGNPVKFDGKNLPIRRLPPLLGEHTKEIMTELGFSDEQFQKALESHAVAYDSYS